MREFFQAFTAPRNFPVNLYIAVMVLAGVATGVTGGRAFTVLVFSPSMPAIVGAAALTLLLWAVSLVPLYFLDLPMQKPLHRAGVVASLALAVFCAYYGGGGMAADSPPELKPLAYAAWFYFYALMCGLMCMHEKRDEFEPRQDIGPGAFAVVRGRILCGAKGVKLPGLWAVIRRRVLPVKGERS